MNPEQWQQIERVYHEALERRPAERAAYLAEACAGDTALRAEVESLLQYHQNTAAFIEPVAGDRPLSPIAGLVERVREAAAPGHFSRRVFGSYEVQALIAAGGMGEVYRAIDTRLDRVVAIKILPGTFSADSERRERFRREARIVSSLNHPHICALYDVGVHDETPYLVMEYVDGETLHQRILRGPVAPAQALEYLIQMADALDKAHRRGVVHRDLKPGNIMLTRSGVKLLDFGLAARRGGDGPAADVLTTDSLQPALTVDGTIMGTVQYMAPEQLHGQPADARSDIFAFGAIAYEMLTGRRAFEGGSRAGLIGAILRDEPKPIPEVVPRVPTLLVRTVTRCLAKDPDERWQTANDLLFQLRSLSPSPDGISAENRPQPRMAPWAERAMWLAAGVVVALVAASWLPLRQRAYPDPGPAATRIEFPLTPADGTLASDFDAPFAVSPDGRHIAYVAVGRDQVARLVLHSLAGAGARVLSGTEGASAPFWSPDNQWIAFFVGSSLRKVRIATGAAQIIADDVSPLAAGSWSTHEEIVFPSFIGTLTRVRATGGPLTQLNVNGVFSPQFLPDGRHIIYASGQSRAIHITSIDGEAPRTLMTFPVRLSAIAYASGHLFFVRDGTLYARPLDEQQLKLAGEEIRVAEGVPITTPTRTPFSVSNAGVLAYWTHPLGSYTALSWFERNGQRTAAIPAPQQYRGFDINADGSRLVFARNSRSGSALFMRDLADTAERQLTFDESFTPQLSADGRQVLFAGPGPVPPPKLFLMNDLAGARATLVATTTLPTFPSDWSGDGRSALVVRIDPRSRHDVWHQELPKGPERRLAFNTDFFESQAKVSPDNRWIAFVTDRSGRDEVWVATFPSGDAARPVSQDGGSLPQWTSGGKELVYLGARERLVAVPFDNGEIGKPQPLFEIANRLHIDRILTPTGNGYVPTADGQRFLVAERAHEPNVPPITVVVNWRASVVR